MCPLAGARECDLVLLKDDLLNICSLKNIDYSPMLAGCVSMRCGTLRMRSCVMDKSKMIDLLNIFSRKMMTGGPGVHQ